MRLGHKRGQHKPNRRHLAVRIHQVTTPDSERRLSLAIEMVLGSASRDDATTLESENDKKGEPDAEEAQNGSKAEKTL
jgi:hypothetical protein